MFKSNHLFMSLLAVLLALALFPYSALAITEDSVEPAPEISLPEDDINDISAETPEDYDQDDTAYRPYPGSYPERGTVSDERELNIPRLTDAELATVRELMAARDAGEQPDFSDRHYASSEKVFEAGVYALDPELFGGNTFYVILPYFQMNRAQLLSLISAFDELGIPFDPDSLNSTNCARGTQLLYNSATRELSREEQTRMEVIREQIRRGVFDTDAFTAEAYCRSVQVQMPGYSDSAYDYLEPFCFYPYRAMTDNELATFALAQETVWEIHPDRLEKKARQYAHRVFPLPLSMTAVDASRYAYSENYIEFRNSFRIDPENCGGLYASADETPFEVMVEQDYSGKEGSEAALTRILIDYPAMYSNAGDSQPGCGEEELKAAARRWAERYLLVPGEDILSDWVFDSRNEGWGTVQYRLLTTEWLVCLDMFESNAMYGQCCIYNRDYAVEFDDWNLDASGETGAGGTDGTEESAWGVDSYTVDLNARQEVCRVLRLPLSMVTDSITRDGEGYVQYRADYSFAANERAGQEETAAGMPGSMIVYQTPRFSKDGELRVESVFLSYPYEPDLGVRLNDGEYVAAARKWAETLLLIPGEDIREDWTVCPGGTEGSVEYQLQTREWTVYLQMNMDGKYIWSGLYREMNPN